MRRRYCSIFGALHLIRGSRSYFRKESKRRWSKQAAGRCFSNAARFAFRRKAAATRFFSSQCYTPAASVPRDAGKARLLPANLLQTAVLFQGSIDLRIHLEYGVFRSGCRKRDLADLAELGIFDEKNALPFAHVHPYGISTFADLPRAVGAVVKKLTRSP